MNSKTFLLGAIALFCADQSILAAGGASAKEAIRVVGAARGSDVMTRIVAVTGTKGQDQPAVWRVVMVESGGRTFSEAYVQSGRVISQGRTGAVPAGVNQAVSLKKLKFDSTNAFSIAEKAAVKAKIGYDSADYELRCLELSDRPVWFISFRDVRGAFVGDVSIAGDSGSVLSKRFYPPTNGPQSPSQGQVVQQQHRSQAPVQGRQHIAANNNVYQSPQNQGVWDRARQGMLHGGAVARQGFIATRDKVKAYWNRLTSRPTHPSQPYYFDQQRQPQPQPGQTYYYRRY